MGWNLLGMLCNALMLLWPAGFRPVHCWLTDEMVSDSDWVLLSSCQFLLFVSTPNCLHISGRLFVIRVITARRLQKPANHSHEWTKKYPSPLFPLSSCGLHFFLTLFSCVLLSSHSPPPPYLIFCSLILGVFSIFCFILFYGYNQQICCGILLCVCVCVSQHKYCPVLHFITTNHTTSCK